MARVRGATSPSIGAMSSDHAHFLVILLRTRLFASASWLNSTPRMVMLATAPGRVQYRLLGQARVVSSWRGEDSFLCRRKSRCVPVRSSEWLPRIGLTVSGVSRLTVPGGTQGTQSACNYRRFHKISHLHKILRPRKITQYHNRILFFSVPSATFFKNAYINVT